MTDPERPRTTPEGHTPEEPRPTELGKEGTPGAGMTPEVPHAADARAIEAGEAPPPDEPIGEAHGAPAAAGHAAASHMNTHAAASEDDNAHAEPRLGPIDWAAWGYAAFGVLIALVVVALFYVAIS